MQLSEFIVQALIGLIRTMRPRQWTKNAVIFAGIVFDGQLFNSAALLQVIIAFFLLCLVASTIYIINDLVDIEADRLHPRKRYRPLPSGQLPQQLAIAAAIVIPVLALGGAIAMSPQFAVVLIAYFGIHILYSFWLKNVVIIDILAITAGFVLRVAAGVVVVQVANFSPWLYACTGLLALFLAIGKRRQELLLLAENAQNVRVTYKDYNLPLLDEMLRLVITSTFVAYLLYTVEADTIRVANTNLALITVPFVLYALFRYMYLIYVLNEGSAPDEVLLQDRPLLFSILLWGLSFIIIIYLPALV
ncbi:MAG: decaprenyl-phosphate phosphoribosyltransferase [Anaerolineaceae bacterium]|nr:decaprenyl-phosphate phosphoribosyltransferase [Anaerolineaceae bacterium]